MKLSRDVRPSPYSATNTLGPEAGPSHLGLSFPDMCNEKERLDERFLIFLCEMGASRKAFIPSRNLHGRTTDEAS